MARIDCTGAEVNDNDELNSVTDSTVGGTHSFGASTDQARSGSYSWKAERGGVPITDGQEMGTINISGSPTSIACRFSFYISTTSVNEVIFRVNFGTNERIEVTATTIGTDRLTVRGTNGVTSTSTETINADILNKWVDVCVRTTVGGGTESVTMRVGNQSVTTTAANWATSGATSINFGLVTVANFETTIYFDDIIIDTTNADIDDDRFLAFLPPNTGHTPQDQWTSVGGAASTTVAITDNSDTTLIRASGMTAANVAFEMTDLSGTMPSSGFLTKALYLSCRKGSTLDNTTFTYRVRDSSDTSQGSASITSSASPTTSRSALVITTSYTQAELNGLYYRFEYPGAVGGQSSIQEAWGYAEIEANPSLTDSGTVSESTSISVTAPVTDNFTASEVEEAVDASSVAGASSTTYVFNVLE